MIHLVLTVIAQDQTGLVERDPAMHRSHHHTQGRRRRLESRMAAHRRAVRRHSAGGRPGRAAHGPGGGVAGS